MVLAKSLPRAPNTQLVREMIDRPPGAGDHLAMRRQRALQLPADLTVPAEEKNAHGASSHVEQAVIMPPAAASRFCETGRILYPCQLPQPSPQPLS